MLSHITTVGPFFFTQKSRSPRPADWMKRGPDITVCPSILVALLVCCSARNTAHVGDLYPSSSNSSVHLVSFRIVAISPCSYCYFFKKFHPRLVIVHPCHGSRHVVRPFVVTILVSSTRSSHTCDESKILTKPPAEIFWSRNQSFSISSGISFYEGGEGHMQWRKQLLRMFGRELIRINELICWLIKTAVRAVSKNCAERGFFFAASAAKFWKHYISSASERAFPGFFGDILGCSSLSKKRCFSTQEFTHFLSTVSSQRRTTRSDVSFHS